MKKLEYYGVVDKSGDKPRIIPSNKELVYTGLSSLTDGITVKITVQPRYKKASRNQFEWLYGGIYQTVLDYLINKENYSSVLTLDDIDAFFKKKFCTISKYDPIEETTYIDYIDKKEFDANDFIEYTQKIIQFANETWGLLIDTPEEYKEKKDKNGI